MAEMDFMQAMKKLGEKPVVIAKQPDTSNLAPAAAWRAVVDAQATEKRGGEPVPQPFHAAKGVETAHQAWMRAIKPAA